MQSVRITWRWRLCKFVGMIQDVHDPEYYDGAYEVVKADGTTRVCTTKYQGMISEVAVAEAGGEHHSPVCGHCLAAPPVVCVPIPSRTSWLQQAVAPPVVAEGRRLPLVALPRRAPVRENPATAVLTSRSGSAAGESARRRARSTWR